MKVLTKQWTKVYNDTQEEYYLTIAGTGIARSEYPKKKWIKSKKMCKIKA